MQITGSALSLNVADVAASADFAIRHLGGFTQAMAADGFVSLAREDAGFNLIFLQTGLGTFKPASHAGDAGQGTSWRSSSTTSTPNTTGSGAKASGSSPPHRNRAVGGTLLPDARSQRRRVPARAVGRRRGRVIPAGA